MGSVLLAAVAFVCQMAVCCLAIDLERMDGEKAPPYRKERKIFVCKGKLQDYQCVQCERFFRRPSQEVSCQSYCH